MARHAQLGTLPAILDGKDIKLKYAMQKGKNVGVIVLRPWDVLVFRYQAPEPDEYFWIPLNELDDPTQVPVIDKKGEVVDHYPIREN